MNTDAGRFTLRQLPDGLFYDQVGYGDEIMDSLVTNRYLGMFCDHVEKTDIVFLVNHNLITNRVVYIKDDISSGYVTLE